ncbi:hypothetical protein LTR36_006611 [Oleoguttula mirabilis]|uniref:Major facilitator superfamily (MFS) profile domain-containing protein n=1 Tax=Oleoguttula mirabilis TaxID=1507867 RepID=A0AAV9JBW7_9PEZI|nr:hypothetical protein LTR36_006611 [Oleoguttula mirabilis]
MATQVIVELEALEHVRSTERVAPQAEPSAAHANGAIIPNNITRLPEEYTLNKRRSWIVITQLAGINFITSFSNGLLTVGLPTMAADLALHHSLLVWPSSVYALTSGTCLLLGGSVADVVGPRSVNLTGGFFLSCFILASGLSRTGLELIMFRAMQGVASALVVPSSFSIVSNSVEQGKPRNLGFACLGLAMPLGFSLGLVLGGVFVSSLDWRVGYYIGGVASFLFFLVGILVLPAGVATHSAEAPTLGRLATEVDWVGAGLASSCLATFSYVLAFQDVQSTSPLGASLRLLPSFIVGTIVNLTTGIIVDRVPATYAVLVSSGLCAGAPLLMALINPHWPYWYNAFFAQMLAPLSGAALFTVGLLIVSDVFPTRTQALAGAVFNTASQLGVSIGLTIVSIISTTVTSKFSSAEQSSSMAIMAGYRAGFWAMFAWMVAACLVGGVGLRKIEGVGMKRD